MPQHIYFIDSEKGRETRVGKKPDDNLVYINNPIMPDIEEIAERDKQILQLRDLLQKNKEEFKVNQAKIESETKNNSYLKVVFCKGCGMVQQDPIPSEKEVNEYYSNEYRQDYKRTNIPKIKHVYRAGNLALERINFLKERNIIKGNLLDVGAGGGEFTYLSGRLGFISQGIEPNIGYSNYARKEYGINIQTGHLSDVCQKFDLITMFHALEHIPNPIQTFKLLYELLNNEGSLFIEVPNIETKDASPHNIYFKAHIHYFSRIRIIRYARYMLT